MYTQRLVTTAAVLIAMTAAVSSAQTVTSAHSGLLHYFDGSVSIDGAPVEYKVGKFSEIKENSVLKTEQGRAEVLLTPGVYLRIGENSSIKMLDNRLLSTRVQFLSGSMILESDDPTATIKDPAVTIVYKDYQIKPLKEGIVEIASDPASLKVFKGQVETSANEVKVTVHDGHMALLSAALPVEKFDEKQVDDLYLWARDRGAALSAANMASARSLSANGFSPNSLYLGGMYPGLGFNSAFNGGWYFNPAVGMYTYMPYGGTFWSPFGYGFFSPGSIYSFYSPDGYYWYGGGGARTTSFVPQPVSGTVVRSGLRGGTTFGAGAPGRLTAGHSGLGLPVAGSSSGSVAASRGGGFSPALARSGNGGFSSAAGGRFGGNNGGFNSSNNSASSSFGGISGASSGGGAISGGGAGGGGGFSGGGAAGGHAGGGGGGGGHAR
jgi:hypothetical protein